MIQDTMQEGQNQANPGAEENEPGLELEPKLWAVGFFEFGTNVLTIEVITATSWRDAALGHSKSLFTGEEVSMVDWGGSIEEAKEFAFNMDGAFDILEVKPPK